MKILVLGSEGFIGSHLCSKLANEPMVKLFKADIVSKHGDDSYQQVLSSSANFDSLFEEEFDYCINCTGAAHVGRSLSNPLNDFRLNTVNVFEVLSSIKNKNEKCKFINISSAAVYGEPEELPILESSRLSPLSPYGFHKLYSENILKEFSAVYNIDTLSLRVFSCYGPGLKKQLFWDAFQKLKKKELSFWGTGNESRDFIYVEDIADILIKICKKSFSGNLVFNVASGIETRIEDAINCFIEEMGADSAIYFGGQVDEGQPSNWVANISNLRSFIDFKLTPLEDGLAEYCKWLKREDL